MTTGADVIAEARTWLGTRWRHQGVLKGVGCDCIGLVGGVAAALGISDAWVDPTKSAPFKGYGREPDPSLLYRGCAEFLLPVFDKNDARLGDILLLRFHTEPMHFAFLSQTAPRRMMLHALMMARKVVENGIDAMWASRIVTVYRFPGVEA
jgi:NlpC/P60 family putative phage cell wall peptidase